VYGLGDVFKMINPEVSIVNNGEKPNVDIDIEYDLSKLEYFVKGTSHDVVSDTYITIPNLLKETSASIVGEINHPRIGICFSQSEISTPVNFLDFVHNLTIQQTMNFHYFSFIVSQNESCYETTHLNFSEFCYGGQDYALIASIVAQMDIIISFDNVIAHLAGALGKPILLLVPFYEIDSNVQRFVASYQHVTIFKQQYADDWVHIFQQISLLRKVRPEDQLVKPFKISGYITQHKDCLPLPDLTIETAADLFKLLDIDVGILQIVSIETTSICNLNCHYCPNSTVGRDNEFMKESTFYNIVDSLKEYNNNYTGEIYPHFYGEPLLDTRLESFVMYVKKQHPLSIVKIYTNGELLSIERYYTLKEAGVDQFVISQHTDKPSNNILKLYNYTIEKSIKVDDIVYNETYKQKIFFNRGGLVDTEPHTANRLSQMVHCTGVHNQMTFDYKGNAVLCCQDYLSNHTYGNIDKQSISEIWNNSVYMRTRNLILFGFLPLKICRTCMYG
jgi:8-amino-3,8-dideoxy-alpha-D-manno-octulosonate transaminase